LNKFELNCVICYKESSRSEGGFSYWERWWYFVKRINHRGHGENLHRGHRGGFIYGMDMDLKNREDVEDFSPLHCELCARSLCPLW